MISNYTTTTTATTDPWCWNDRLFYITPVAIWKAPEFVIPKWWRWYDIFRTWVKPKQLRLLDGTRRVMLRIQERYPIGQRRKQKRRAYVHRIIKEVLEK